MESAFTAHKSGIRKIDFCENKKTGATASKMFKSLIMDGKLTDRQIWNAVNEKFYVRPDKFNYVSTWRCVLKQQGKNPPARIKEGWEC
jgi:hypothetical protein